MSWHTANAYLVEKCFFISEKYLNNCVNGKDNRENLTENFLISFLQFILYFTYILFRVFILCLVEKLRNPILCHFEFHLMNFLCWFCVFHCDNVDIFITFLSLPKNLISFEAFVRVVELFKLWLNRFVN